MIGHDSKVNVLLLLLLLLLLLVKLVMAMISVHDVDEVFRGFYYTIRSEQLKQTATRSRKVADTVAAQLLRFYVSDTETWHIMFPRVTSAHP